MMAQYNNDRFIRKRLINELIDLMTNRNKNLTMYSHNQEIRFCSVEFCGSAKDFMTNSRAFVLYEGSARKSV